jgi:hypothetical protein
VNAKEQYEYDKQLPKKDDFDALLAKGEAVKVLNVPHLSNGTKLN